MDTELSLMPDDTDGFPELVQAIYEALVDLCDDVDLDYAVLAAELAHTAWLTLTPLPGAPAGGETAAPHEVVRLHQAPGSGSRGGS
jgi:hypothetical protein